MSQWPAACCRVSRVREQGMLLKRVYMALAVLIALPLAAGQAGAKSPNAQDLRVREDPRDLCAQAIAEEERSERIPHRLMQAIALTKSGRWDPQRQAKIAWPWTINAEGQGRYFPTIGAAITAVKALQARGVNSIDVGCMQVNLRYHGDAFRDLAEAFDPATNVGYAADFLKELYQETGSWVAATGRYHSATPELGVPYRSRVLAAWNDTRRLDFRDLAADRRRMKIVPVDTARTARFTIEQRVQALRAALAEVPPDERVLPLREIWLRSNPAVTTVPVPSSPARTTALASRASRPVASQPASGAAAAATFAERRIAYLEAWRQNQQQGRAGAPVSDPRSGVTVLRGAERNIERVQVR